MKAFTVVSINLSVDKGTVKKPVRRGELRTGYGFENDAHSGEWHRQVSLLAEEDIVRSAEGSFAPGPGDYAENITTRGIDLAALPIGARLRIGTAELEITQIGKECHTGCSILELTGKCIMPVRGVFAKVLKGGEVKIGDTGYYRV